VLSSQGIDPNSALPEDEWFIYTDDAAIGKLRREGSYNNLEEVHAGVLDVAEYPCFEASFRMQLAVKTQIPPKQMRQIQNEANPEFEASKMTGGNRISLIPCS
jgi:hypothetical protein